MPTWKIGDIGGGRDQERVLLALRHHCLRQLRADALWPTAGERKEETGKSLIQLVGHWRISLAFQG
jgi:hypothetical protein